MLGVSRTWLYDAARDGRIPSCPKTSKAGWKQRGPDGDPESPRERPFSAWATRGAEPQPRRPGQASTAQGPFVPCSRTPGRRHVPGLLVGPTQYGHPRLVPAARGSRRKGRAIRRTRARAPRRASRPLRREQEAHPERSRRRSWFTHRSATASDVGFSSISARFVSVSSSSLHTRSNSRASPAARPRSSWSTREKITLESRTARGTGRPDSLIPPERRALRVQPRACPPHALTALAAPRTPRLRTSEFSNSWSAEVALR